MVWHGMASKEWEQNRAPQRMEWEHNVISRITGAARHSHCFQPSAHLFTPSFLGIYFVFHFTPQPLFPLLCYWSWIWSSSWPSWAWYWSWFWLQSWSCSCGHCVCCENGRSHRCLLIPMLNFSLIRTFHIHPRPNKNQKWFTVHRSSIWGRWWCLNRQTGGGRSSTDNRSFRGANNGAS